MKLKDSPFTAIDPETFRRNTNQSRNAMTLPFDFLVQWEEGQMRGPKQTFHLQTSKKVQTLMNSDSLVWEWEIHPPVPV